MAKLEQGQTVVIINYAGRKEDGYVIENPKVDKHGLIEVKKNDVVKSIHPKRIVIEEEENNMTVNNSGQTAVIDAPAPVDINQLASHGELWSKSSVPFDNKTEVNTYCLIFPNRGRYISFNTYNGTYGKKGIAPPIADMQAGLNVGYEMKNGIEGQREKLVKAGYKKVS